MHIKSKPFYFFIPNTLFFSILFFFLFVSSAVARDITLTWDPNNEPDLSHYIVYWGLTSGDYTENSGNIGLETEYSVEIPDDGQIYYFAVTAVDEAGLESDYSNEVNTEGMPARPVADAGDNQSLNEGDFVTLDASGSTDLDGDIVSYEWTQTGGTEVVLDSYEAVQPVFTAPVVGTEGESLTFMLTVTDSEGLSSTDTCTIDVAWVDDPPVADAGPAQNIDEGLIVTLDASDSYDSDGSIVSWEWTQTGGTQVSLDDSSSAQPSFTSPDVSLAGESLTFQVTVTDSGGFTSTATCTIDVAWVNEAPTANAGSDRNIAEGLQATLDGSASSDADGNITAWQWIQTGGTTVTLKNSNTAAPSFITPDVGQGGESLTFQLTVTDSEGLASTDTCSVNVTWVNEAPVADAGDNRNVDKGDEVCLDGSGSFDNDGTISSWEWVQIEGTTVTLDNPDADKAFFNTPITDHEEETLVFELTVTDAQGLKSTDTCIIYVAHVNTPPIANAGGDQNIDENVQVTLDGSSSLDNEGAIVEWEWVQTGGPTVSLDDPTAETTYFTSPNVGSEGTSLTFELTVTDSEGLTNTDICIVNIVWVNEPPISDAGDDQSVNAGDLVVLDGSASTDSDGEIVLFDWIQIGGTIVELDDPTAVYPTFDAPYSDSENEVLTFKLIVTDDGGLKSSSICMIDITSPSQTLSFKSGWNLVSISTEEITPVDEILEPIMDSIVSIWAFSDGSWKVYDPSNPIFSDLNEIKPGTGLWINMQNDAELAVNGTPIANGVDISEGWNLVGFNKSNTQDMSEAISSISENIESVWAYTNEGWKVYDPQNPIFSDLTTMEPGLGYWIKANASCRWTN